MSRTENRPSNLDRAVADVAGEPLDPRVIEQAAARVWGHLSGEAAGPMEARMEAASREAASAPTLAAGPLRSCDDFQRLIPAYLAGELAPARALLLEDHTRSCIPCRRALREAQNGAPMGNGRGESRRNTQPVAATHRRAGLALAASLVAMVGVGSFFLVREMGFSGQAATVAALEGHVLEVEGQSVRPLAVGAAVEEGEQVRTARGSRAVLRLADGSLVEMNERSALSYDERRSGTTLDLAQGRIIVQAAKQKEGRHLYVATADCRVAVVGTIFSVNRGTKGSRVSVVEGRVRVARTGHDDLLLPGQQVTTAAAVATVPVSQEIGWSKDAGRYRTLLAELTALGKEIDAQVERPGLRTSTRLLDLAPAGTMVYVGLPNLTASLADTERLLAERLAENPTLAQWWQETLGTGERAESFHDAIDRLAAVGRYLGQELAVAFTPEGPVALAEVSDARAVRTALAEEAERLAAKAGHPVLVLVDGPAAGAPAGDALLAWVSDGFLVVTPKPTLLAQMGAVLAAPDANPFRGTSFHDKVAAAYADGAGWLFSGDLKALMREGDRPGEVDRKAEELGIRDLDHFIVNRRDGASGRTETVAALTFDRPRRGLASWLAAPAPMGALDFVSAEASLAGSFVVRDPATLVDDLIAAFPDLRADLEKLRAEHGFDLRDLAGALGGELAFAVDGPLLPTPSWKLVVEVYDPARLDSVLRELATRLDAESRREGHGGISLTSEEAGGRTYHTLAKADSGFALHYTYEGGYFVAAPSRALLDRTLKQRAAGNTLVSSARFRDLLPADRRVNFSALVFHDLGPVLAPLAEQAERLSGETPVQRPAQVPGSAPAAALLGMGGPTLSYAYGEEDRILFASNSQAGPLGLNLGTLVGLGGLAGHAGANLEDPSDDLGADRGVAR